MVQPFKGPAPALRLFNPSKIGYSGLTGFLEFRPMRTTLTALLISTLVLSGCSTVRESRANPFNWFGGSSPTPVTTSTVNTNPLIPDQEGIFARNRSGKDAYLGAPVETIADLTIERVPGGAIIRATGIAAEQGVFDVQLTPENEDELPVDGVLSYRLEAIRSPSGRVQGTDMSREVIAARKITDQTLQDVRTIRVSGVLNAQTSRR